MTTEQLTLLTKQQADYTRCLLDDFVKVGYGSDDGFDATVGAVELTAEMMRFDLDGDTEGFNKAHADLRMNHSVDGMCQQLYEILKED